MKEQNYKNHGQLVPSFHFLTFSGILIVLIVSIICLFYPNKLTYLIPITLILMSLVVISIALHSRLFALKAQDRAIRAEENFRYYVLTGKKIDSKISLKQIIALRFASDEELTELVNKTIEENLSQKEIKKAIKNWRADYYRV